MNEVRIQADALRKALAFAASVTERRNTIPVLGMVKIDIANPTSTITGTDLDMEASATFEIAELTGTPFSFLIRPRLLADVIRYAENLVTISKADDILTIKADDMEVQVRDLLDVTDWPSMNHKVQYSPHQFPEADLLKAMRAANISISTEETRYYLNGAFFHDAGGGTLTIVSTNGHKLTRYRTDQPWDGSPKLIVPRKACHILTGRLTAGGNKAVQIATGENRISFSGDGWELKSKCIDGTFPDYTRVIPQPSEAISFAVTSAALRRFPKTCERSRAIKIEPDAGKMSQTSPDGITVTMPVSGSGKECGFNLEYLKAFAELSGTIKVSGSGSGDPFRVLSEDPNLLQVIMPMRV